jgi:hypothetical protein
MTIHQPTRSSIRRLEYLVDTKGYADRIKETAQESEALKRETSSVDNSSRNRIRMSYG